MTATTVFQQPDAGLRQATADALAGQDVITRLPLRALAVTGPDALTFLQGQVTTDMREVSAEQSRLGCLLNLKGRIQSSFRLLGIENGFLLLLPEDQLEPARQRLAKYAVFSKVVLGEQPLHIHGVLGDRARARLEAAGWHWPDAAQQTTGHGDARLIRLPGASRALLLTADTVTDWPANGAAQAAWHCASIASGELLLPATASERWQPQEMDYHQLHGVSYQKGCYLGQEIVARLYFRGQLKTALMRLRGAWPEAAGLPAPELGQDILSEGRAVGELISAAWPDDGHVELLALVRQDAGGLSLHSGDQRLDLSPLPFTR